MSVRVDSTLDAVDVTPGDGVCATAAKACTLRAAIQETNTNPGGDSIILPRGTYRLTILGRGEVAGATGDLNIADDLDIVGAGAARTIIDGGGCPGPAGPPCAIPSTRDRVLSVESAHGATKVAISGVTIQNGSGDSFTRGGGVYVTGGASLELYSSRIWANRAGVFGGGISVGGSLRLVQSTVEQNRLPTSPLGGRTASGGGIYIFAGGAAEVEMSTIAGNEAARGGGIANGGFLQINASTISGNGASASGGGLLNDGYATISFSTIAGNEANRPVVSGSEARGGGGIYNRSGRIAMGNSILAGNDDYYIAPDCLSADPAIFNSFRHNVVGRLTKGCNLRDFTGGPTLDQVGSNGARLDARLGPLATNGGPTRTRAPLAGSAAIDRGTPQAPACALVDQRGFGRPVDGDGDRRARCDVGAVEYSAMKN